MRSFLSALLVVLLALAGVGLWLYMEQSDTLSALRMQADREALGQSVDIEPTPSSPDTGPDAAPDADPAAESGSGPAPDDRALGALPEDTDRQSEEIGDGRSGNGDLGNGDLGNGDAGSGLPDGIARTDNDGGQTDTSAVTRLSDPLPMPMDDDTTVTGENDAGDNSGGAPGETPSDAPSDAPNDAPSDTPGDSLGADRLPPLPGEPQDDEPSDTTDDIANDTQSRQEENPTGSDIAALPEPIETETPPSESAPSEDDSQQAEPDPDAPVSDTAPSDQPDQSDQQEADSVDEPAEDSAAGDLAEDPADTSAPAPTSPAPTAPTPANPAIAIVVMDLGQSSAATESAIQRLPGAVTLAFTPYASTLSRWVPQALAAGHEVLMMVPMEPVSYPRDDPGPQTLLTSLTAETNLGRLDWALERAEGYVGVVNNMGSRMTASRDSIRPILEEIHDRDLLFLDSRTARNTVVPDLAGEIGLPVAVNDRFIDRVAARNDIDAQLAQLESVARQRGYAVGIAGSYPVTFERLAAWLPTLEDKGIDLVPITRIANGAGALQAGAEQ